MGRGGKEGEGGQGREWGWVTMGDHGGGGVMGGGGGLEGGKRKGREGREEGRGGRVQIA